MKSILTMRQGDPNAAVSSVEPVIMRPMFAVNAHPIPPTVSDLPLLMLVSQTYVPNTSVTFVSKASIDSGVIASYNLRKRVEAVRNCRSIGKKDMKFNDVMPKMKVDPETYVSCTYFYSPSKTFLWTEQRQESG